MTDFNPTTDNPLDLIMMKEPQVLLADMDGFRIFETNKAPKVWVIEGRHGFGGWYENIDAAKAAIQKRQDQIKRNRKRIAGEKTVVRRVVRDLLAAGYSLTVDDGEDEPVKKSTKFSEIMAALMQTDEDYLYTHKQGCPNSFVRFVYGNDSWEVICDHGVSLEKVLKGAQEVCERLEARGR